MNAKTKISLITVFFLCGCSFCAGYFLKPETTTSGLETDIIELSRRNKSISTRINDLEAAARVNAERSQSLADGLTGLSNGLVEAVGRAQSIEDRAKRIDYLARVLDKGITELILKVQDNQKSNLGTDSSGGS